jgi:peptidoglycan/xylan/chitin deacetylase (PgdA/CDA1 family)
MFEYGSRVGFWRVHRLFKERGLPLTVFGCALALERNPKVATAIRESDWDVCSHGWRWVKHYELSEAEEREHIRKAVESMKKTVGERPLGWYCRYGPSVNTRRLVVEEGGFLYDSDAYNDELPYWVRVGSTPHLVVPYSLTANDSKFGSGGFFTASDYFTFVKDGFDVLYREGQTQPKMMSLGLHLRLIGHPSRAAGLERALDYIAGHKDVWFTRRIDIARHWAATHPAPAR